MSKNVSKVPLRTRKPNLALRGLRLNKGLSPNGLSELTGVSAQTIRLSERGHVPSPRVMFELARFFEVEVLDIWPLPGQEKALARG
jgi:transcriptional regulator with XRE-family HTH domain